MKLFLSKKASEPTYTGKFFFLPNIPLQYYKHKTKS